MVIVTGQGLPPQNTLPQHEDYRQHFSTKLQVTSCSAPVAKLSMDSMFSFRKVGVFKYRLGLPPRFVGRAFNVDITQPVNHLDVSKNRGTPNHPFL